MKDYEGYHGFGQIAQGDVDELSKALGAGYQNPPVSGSNALRVESLGLAWNPYTRADQPTEPWSG